MRKLLSLFLITTLNSYAAAPLGVQGQSGNTNYPPVVKVPYNQNTIVSGGSLLESGNENMLVNPNFEAPTLSGWTCTTGTCTVESTVFSSGKQSAKIVPAANIFDFSQQISTPANIQKQGIMGLIYNFPSTCTTASVQTIVDGTTQTTVSTTSLILDGAFHSIEIPTTFGATSAKIRAFSTASCTGNIYIDKAYISQGLGTQNLMLDNVYSAKVSAAGVISDPSKTGWVSCSSTSPYTCTFQAGLFTVAPNCTASTSKSGSTVQAIQVGIPTSSSVIVTTLNGSTGTGFSAEFQLSCQKSGNDYFAASSSVYSQASGGVESIEALTSTSTWGSTNTGVPVLNITKSPTLGMIRVDSTAANGTSFVALKEIEVKISAAVFGNGTPAGFEITKNSSVLTNTTPNGILSFVVNSQTSTYPTQIGANIKLAVGDTLRIQRDSVNGAGVAQVTLTATPTLNVIVGSFAGVPAVPGYQGNVDTFSVSFGESSISTVCSTSPCYIDQFGQAGSKGIQSGGAVASITRASVGVYTINLNKTYTKLKCSTGAVSTGPSQTPVQCSNCSSVQMSYVNPAFSANVDAYSIVMCQGSY